MQHGKRKVVLHPGDFCFAEPGTHLHTVLGSCIAITLWHPYLNIGGMCHFVLPERPAGAAENGLDGRYAADAMQLFEQAIQLHCTNLQEYEGKIFGGANVTGTNNTAPEQLVGTRNAEIAMNMLISRGIDIKTVHVGETGNRRIIMDVATGGVWVRHQQVDGKRYTAMNGKQ